MESSHLLDGLWHLELAGARLVLPSTPILDDFSAELDTSHLAPAGADTNNVDWFHDIFASLDEADVDNVNWLSDLFSHLEAPDSTPAPMTCTFVTIKAICVGRRCHTLLVKIAFCAGKTSENEGLKGGV
ncbi:hypothetical protein SDRG_08840 [Saprolegnia diclina VS20]|uniref:Uncharacterized protein n=1 Tax=Saprolegnia diclina (strain VS20) TaxID=1156394 RepID=T0RN11_SAPDV|nr:hypothetical protein SDRG_08840 [Saprolegnia diclina VS20]EQC33738.1 hypothetical protein SDRG_08840 [Saprolegnia diclina VS20]|eukprot:XP_008612961.1 hypothetical protein SDRG_08840 [Saprolegnia diclina VS20]